jgi:hypothetical protein
MEMMMKALTALFSIMVLGFFIAGPMSLVTVGSAAKASDAIACFSHKSPESSCTPFPFVIAQGSGCCGMGSLNRQCKQDCKLNFANDKGSLQSCNKGCDENYDPKCSKPC